MFSAEMMEYIEEQCEFISGTFLRFVETSRTMMHATVSMSQASISHRSAFESLRLFDELLETITSMLDPEDELFHIAGHKIGFGTGLPPGLQSNMLLPAGHNGMYCGTGSLFGEKFSFVVAENETSTLHENAGF